MKKALCLLVCAVLAGCGYGNFSQPVIEINPLPAVAGQLLTLTPAPVKVVTLAPRGSPTPWPTATLPPDVPPGPTPTPPILVFLSGAQPQPATDKLPAQPSKGYTLITNSDGAWLAWAPGSAEIAPYDGELPPPVECTSLNGFCPSPHARFDLTQIQPEVGPVETGVLDYSTGQSRIIPYAALTPRAYNTYAWSPGEEFLLFARAWGTPGLYRVEPDTGEAVTMLELPGCQPSSENCAPTPAAAGVTDPFPLPDGRTGFAVQSARGANRLPPGIYTMDWNGAITQLAPLPPIEAQCLDEDAQFLFGRVYWSPDGSAYLYRGPLASERPCPGPYALLGSTTPGAAAYDVSTVLGAAVDFRWGK